MILFHERKSDPFCEGERTVPVLGLRKGPHDEAIEQKEYLEPPFRANYTR